MTLPALLTVNVIVATIADYRTILAVLRKYCASSQIASPPSAESAPVEKAYVVDALIPPHSNSTSTSQMCCILLQ